MFPNTIPLDQRSLIKFLLAGFLAGLVGATLAMGGAQILIPMWLNTKIDKDVAASSTAYLILCSGLISFIIAMISGAYAEFSASKLGFYFMLAILSSAILKEIIIALTDKFKIRSMVLYLLLLVVVLTLVVMVPTQYIKMQQNYDHFMELGLLC